ncbi:MAG: SHOCT domain-containing protein [Alphaproteobacteria bacterium]|nr:SHOCT domain-containing protein [Alphaproteobacteria bacterium]
MKRLWLGLAMSLLAVFGLPVVAWAQQDRDFYGPHMMWGGWYGMFMGPLMMIIFIAVVVVLVVLAVRWLGSGHGASQPLSPTKTPLDILKERFARGEIDKEEFEERRRVLGE